MKTRNYNLEYDGDNNNNNFEEELSIQIKNSLNAIKNESINYDIDETNTIIMNGLNKFKSRSNHELGAKPKLPSYRASKSPRNMSRYDSDTITTRNGYSESRSGITIYGQPLNVNTKAFVEAANRKALMVTFYKNGDAFSRPIRMSIIPGKTFKSFHKLCDYLTSKSMIPLGVRYVDRF